MKKAERVLGNIVKQLKVLFGYRKLHVYQVLYSKEKTKFIFEDRASYSSFLDLLK